MLFRTARVSRALIQEARETRAVRKSLKSS